ncbi:MAG: hypothetical protein AAFP85_15130 [Pseudomonadota bacterium]
MEPDGTISQWFAAMIERKDTHLDASVEAASPPRDDVLWDDAVPSPLQDVLQILLQADGHRLSDSLASPSPAMLTQSAQIETNHLLADILANVTENDGTFAPVTPFGQVSEFGPGLAIYNAAFIPGWPVPPFAKNPEATQEQAARNEAEIVAYLAEQGLNKDLLSKVLKAFKTASDRVGFLVWLSALITVATGTLATLRKEANDPDLDIDNILGLPKNRRFLKI